MRKSIQFIDNNIAVGVFFQIDYDPHTLTVRFITDISNFLNLTITNTICNFRNNRGLHHHIRNFGNDDTFSSAFASFDMILTSEFQMAAAGYVGIHNAFLATDNPGYIADAVFNTLGTASYYVEQDKSIKNHMALIREEKELVNEEIFRACRLQPGEAASGYVYFPGDPDAACYMFCYPIENQLFQFVYHQHKEIHYY